MTDIADNKNTEKACADAEVSSRYEPVFNIPPVTLTMLFLITAVYMLHYFVSDSSYEDAVMIFSFIPQRITQAGQTDILAYITPFSYMFLHGNTLHIVLNGAMLLAVGSGVERIIGKARFIAFYAICGIFAVLFQYLTDIHSPEPLIGASGAISGLFAAVMVSLYKTDRMSGGLRGLATVTIVWTIVNIILGLIGIPGDDTVSVAWVAHLGGFYAGLALFPYFLKRI